VLVRERETFMNPRIRLFGVLLKATLLFVLFNLAFIFMNDIPLGKFSLYNSVFPGRERFPFGETRESYNLSLFDLDAMFASHVLAGPKKGRTSIASCSSVIHLSGVHCSRPIRHWQDN
jgi:hypothetical protein